MNGLPRGVRTALLGVLAGLFGVKNYYMYNFDEGYVIDFMQITLLICVLLLFY